MATQNVAGVDISGMEEFTIVGDTPGAPADACGNAHANKKTRTTRATAACGFGGVWR